MPSIVVAPTSLPLPPPVASGVDASTVSQPTSSPSSVDAVSAVDARAPTLPRVDDGPRTAGSVVLPAVGRPRKGTAAAVRVDGALGEARAALEARRTGYAALIVQHQATIGTLEKELAAIDQRIAQKTGDVRNLIDTKRRLVREIEQNQKMATAAAAYGGLLGLFTFGASAAVGAAMAATAGVAVIKLRDDLRSAERAESDAQRELRSLESLAQVHTKLKSELAQSLGALRTEYAALEAGAPAVDLAAPPRVVLGALEAAARHDERLITNLEAQIGVLRKAKTAAGAVEGQLDATIARLTQDVAALEVRRDESRRALVSALIDLAMVGFGATTALRARGLAPSQKELVLAGLDLLKGDVAGVVKNLGERLVERALVNATDAPLLSRALMSVVSPSSAAPAERIQALITGATTPLSSLQRMVLARLAMVTTFDAEPLARAVVEAPVSRHEASLITRMLEGA